MSDLAAETAAYQAMLEALRLCPPDEEDYAELVEDVERARLSCVGRLACA